MLKKSFWIILILVFVSFNNCTFQKRLYRKGYYVDWFSKKKEINKQNKESINDDEIPVKSVYSLSKVKFDENIFVENTGKKNISKNIVFSSKNLNDSCDKLIMRNGDEQLVKVIEINDREIKYIRCDFLNGPVHTINKNEVYSIKYANGVEEQIYKPKFEEKVKQSNIEFNNESPQYLSQEKTYPENYNGVIILCLIGLILFFPLIIALYEARKIKRLIREHSDKYKGYYDMHIIMISIIICLLTIFILWLLAAILFYFFIFPLAGILMIPFILILGGILLHFYLTSNKDDFKSSL
ncbi:MAG TPA: hypothetical protein PK995_01280 [Bacteroidia bacterium]|nr:hypothetical protein [Bacteroidia bacterium]